MILETERLSKSYGKFQALDGLTCNVRPGEVVGLLGPNGSGKSTALRLLLGFLRPSSGRAQIAGHDCWSQSHLARRHVAYLPGELRLYENMTGRQFVDFLEGLRPGIEHHDPGEMAKQFDIDLSRPLSQLSSGMKRKVALLAVLMPHTPLVILDEPTNTLDPSMRDELLAQLVAARDRGQAILFSSHVLSEVEHVCDRVLILRRGQLVCEQAVAPLRSVKRLEVRFERPVETIPEMPGVSVVAREGASVSLECAGPLADAMAWLGGQPVADIRIEPVGLASVYRRYHSAEIERGR